MAIESNEPENTVKAYKLFRVHKDHPGKLFPLFVDANTPVEMNKWVDAKEGEMKDGKVKSKIGALAYRPGWHAGDLPVATHIGEKSDPSKTAPDRRPANHAWAEVEMPNDVDWQSEATKRGTNAQGRVVPVKAHITDQIPKGGHYRYKTNSNMTGNWLIGGSMKVNKVLTDAEVARINKNAGAADLPRTEPFAKKTFGFASGGNVSSSVIAPDEFKAEEYVNYKAERGTMKPFDYENAEHVDNVAKIAAKHKDFSQIPGVAGHLANSLSQGSYKFIEDPRIQSAIKQAGHNGYFFQGKEGKQQMVRKAEGGVVPSIEQMKAEMMTRFKGLGQMQSIGANEAPGMAIKAFVPTSGSPDNNRLPVGGVDTTRGPLPVGGIDMNKGQPGQQLQAPPGMDQMPQGDQPPGGMPGPSGGMPPGGPSGMPGGSNILNMTPQGQAMAAMKPQGLAKGGQPSISQMRQALMANGGSSKGYLTSTPSKPDPQVGTRFKAAPQGNLAPRQKFNIENYEGKGSIVPIPYDATTRDNLVSEISGRKLQKPLMTEGGFDYSLDKQNMAQNIGGASNLGIAGRVAKRVDQAAKENPGDVFLMPNTMSDSDLVKNYPENFSHHPAHIILDLMEQRQLGKNTIKTLNDDLRSQVEIVKGANGPVKTTPYTGFVGFDHPELSDQLQFGGRGLGTTAGNLRKKIVERLGQVNIQKLLDYNLGDVRAGILDPDIATDPKAYMGRTVVKASPGAPLRLSKHKSYDTDYAGTNVGGMGNRPLEIMMPDVYSEIDQELSQRPAKTEKTPAQKRAQVVGALEKRKERFAQPINARVINNSGLYEEGLKQGEFDPKNVDSVLAYFKRKGGYKKGGKVKLHSDQDTMALELSRKSKKAK